MAHQVATCLRTRRRRLLGLVLALLVTLLVAAVANALLDTMQAGGDTGRLFSHTLDEGLGIFALSSVVVWVVLLAVVAVTGRLWVSCGIVCAAALGTGFASATKMGLRQEPVYPSDLAFLGQGGFLVAMVRPGVLVAVAAVLALIVLLATVVGRGAARAFPPVRRRVDRRAWRRSLVARLLVLTAAVSLLGYAAGFNEPGNRLRAGYEASGAAWAFWSQKVNYGRNGFVAGYLYNLPGPAMEVPEGYSRARMERLTATYAEAAGRRNAGRSAGTLADVNVVLVLSEALTDPTRVEGVELGEDPIPFTRELMASTRSGEMLAQLFGGGTANMEFEAVTGLSMNNFLPQVGSAYQSVVSREATFPSAARYLAGLGHATVGVHPYTATMYQRYAAYPALAIDELVDETRMEGTHIDDGQFVSDASTFEEVERQLRESDDPVFANVVTMQNHYPMAGSYHDPVAVRGVSGEVADHLGHYARGLRHSDDALRRFVEGLERSAERTAVVVYGDHAPAFWDGEIYERNGDAAFKRTPWLMWTNFETLPTGSDAALTSPIHFLPTLLDDLDAPVPPFYELLLQLRAEVPAMEQGAYVLPDGRQVTEDRLTPRARRLLADYRLVQYDLAVGERWSQEAMFAPPALAPAR